ncbi:hypothetical protein VIBAE_B30001 [Vibrio aestuarianus subsp. francensis]|nr:hypothetical protein VIBAE_B30001 [Vibrio aestuarianus subsp. francensis]
MELSLRSKNDAFPKTKNFPSVWSPKRTPFSGYQQTKEKPPF